MNFKYKCLLQSFFSIVPKGDFLNYIFQKKVTKTLPPNETVFFEKVQEAYRHFNNFEENNKLEHFSKNYYEFGAGWTLTIPLSMSLLGFEVFCVDIKKLIIPELISDSLNKFEFYKQKLPFTYTGERGVEKKGKDILSLLDKKNKLHYIAPKDARDTGFNEGMFDFISSTATLEHVPKDDILSILRECYRILAPGGILSMTIDYKDHWAYFDKNISFYNFLKYSDKEWKRYNPTMHFQNRLRHSEYIELIEQTEFSIVKIVPELPDDKDKLILDNLDITDCYRKYDRDDLAIKGAEIVLIK